MRIEDLQGMHDVTLYYKNIKYTNGFIFKSIKCPPEFRLRRIADAMFSTEIGNGKKAFVSSVFFDDLKLADSVKKSARRIKTVAIPIEKEVVGVNVVGSGACGSKLPVVRAHPRKFFL